ncbi:Aspartyl/glutamyl-tRNA(Asn/Gln) amidotransferase subunit C [Borrelia miyamotoi]|uniref:Glutamyl-tRNA(Gln) amidotransferase subunit C n=1 Tax=Borrelia miyamotoi TaxID=47466 RepID=A0AAP9CG87_9SPIR|nr:Asp-tRNA(Asn)/Glu-tRNA(Gln) amidotransferase subunit GatC [Borrelia miyamotoi]AHH05071.1 Glutamyl-tRNA(Gln) amidotransferase subunit C [Borrelia miyamotoi FR64b]ATQ14868.1 Asp-tRNA(Asn)/Glu-tRNA(Gln) amidotransferase subunit GatC [Borrelia miyamotoi]ATQ16050.1 Asp-tRNA(Asn)/Glu-tRNA(Gln) amidotransferase subunit GatC [Borrelia miyamotoi]ATQ17196.1 Asp-tRNA(Asn)/Glu-tRNA(Gln) amidotransferase subunit GatC [Borrelia miyamotoi]ATQ18298.1 Asp-tRNA(Asn)/Glu-tRNA(Gln) amidotransferase subunit Gat
MEDIHLENSLKLSLLRLSEKEEQKFVEKFEKIIGMLNKISQIEVRDDVQKKTGVITDCRNDEILSSLSIESIKSFSNVFVDGYFSSPKVLE